MATGEPPTPTRLRRAQDAIAALLAALDVRLEGDMEQTPARAAALWTDHLLSGEGADLAAIIGSGAARAASTPVVVTAVGVHLVCPHHLTVAFGHAHVAYAPAGRVVGFGTLAELARACTARFVLQEDATVDIAAALVTHLHAAAAVALIEAVHPCHNVPHPRSHDAHAVTWGRAGDPEAARPLEALLLAALRREAPSP